MRGQVSTFNQDLTSRKWIAFVSMFPILVPGWLGHYMEINRGGKARKLAILSIGLALSISLPHILSQPDIRYRLSLIDPLWIIFGSWFVISQYQRIHLQSPGESTYPAYSEGRGR